MDNVVLTAASQISPSGGVQLNQDSTGQNPSTEETTTINVESNPLAPVENVEQTNVDGNVQAHLDFNYQAHDVALAAANGGTEKANGHKLGEHHKMDIDDGFDHPEKGNSCCSMLNKFFLVSSIVCFALLLCIIALFVTNLYGFDSKSSGREPLRIPHRCQIIDPFTVSDKLIEEEFFNISHPNGDGILLVLARRGASIYDILIPYRDANGHQQYRSIVLKANDQTYFGSVRFGFDDEVNSFNMTNQLPSNYPYLDAHRQDWSMFADVNKPFRARFVDGFTEIIYEFSTSNKDEFTMKTIVSPPINQQLIADPTNNIYFNLRGRGDLSTHFLNVSLSTSINIKTDEKIDGNQFSQVRRADQMAETRNYFQRLDRAGLGKNHIGTLTESETETTLNIFSDHVGLIIDPTGVADMNGTMVNGIRMSPRQSPSFQQRSIYGQTLVIYPSQSIHTTWWQFDY